MTKSTENKINGHVILFFILHRLWYKFRLVILDHCLLGYLKGYEQRGGMLRSRENLAKDGFLFQLMISDHLGNIFSYKSCFPESAKSIWLAPNMYIIRHLEWALFLTEVLDRTSLRYIYLYFHKTVHKLHVYFISSLEKMGYDIFPLCFTNLTSHWSNIGYTVFSASDLLFILFNRKFSLANKCKSR